MKSRTLLSGILVVLLALTGCSGGSAPLKDLAETYAAIADNNQEMSEAFQAVYQAPRDQQAALQEKAVSIAEGVKSRNAELAGKAAGIAGKLQGSDIDCEVSEALGVKVNSARFTTVNANDKMANIIITAEIEGTPSGTPYFFLMDGDEVLYKSAAGYNGEGTVTVNFWITTAKGPEMARTLAKTRSVKLVTQAEYQGGAVAGVSEEALANVEPAVSEPAYEGNGGSNAVDAASADGVRIEKGASLVAALKSAKNVTYEYNADSGIWAHIDGVSIVIDESQLNQKGIDFISSVYSDIEPDLAFSPDYLKPDAKILQIEK